MEQEKIDVTRATPVSNTDAVKGSTPRRGAPLWLQLLLSLVVIVVAVGVAALFNTTANDLVKRVGVSLPLLNAPAEEAQAQPAAAPSGQARQGQGGQQQTGQAQGQTGGQRQGQGAAAGRGGGSFNRTAVVVTAPVTSGTINNKLTAIGEGSAFHSVTVTAPSGGTLMSVDVKPGDSVAAGAKLATLDADTQQNAYDKAKLAAEDADAALARAQSLAKSNSIPQSQLDAAKLAADNAKLALQAAQIALNQRTITTPIAGTVGLIQVTPGNQITAQTVVTTIEDSSEILINFWVPERYSSQIGIGAPVTATSAALPGQTFEGTIAAVDNKIDSTSRTLQVQAEIPNREGRIKPGMSFSVDMAFPGQQFPAVDPLSIQWSNDGAYVWKVVDGKAVKGMVEIVQRNSDGVLVKGDVKAGDAVVTQGVLQLTANAAVRPLDAGPPAAATPEGGEQRGPLPPASSAAPQGGAAQAPQAAGEGDATQPSAETAAPSAPSRAQNSGAASASQG